MEKGVSSVNSKIIQIKKEQIHTIKPMWEKLNELHLNLTQYFKEHYANTTFEKRCEKFLDADDLLIQVVKDDLISLGYCVSTIDRKVGEIDSLFIEDGYRKYGYGNKLVNNCIKWFKEKKCETIFVAVGEGNESVMEFYKKFDFYPRMTYLQLNG